MRLFLISSFIFALTSCSSKDDGDGDGAPEESCQAEFTLTTADGTTATMSQCAFHETEVDFATMDGALLPQPHALRFAFYGPGGDTGDCWIFWDIAGACPDITEYSMESDGVSVSWNTTDCDVPEAAKGSFEAATGGSVFTQLSSQPVSGTRPGDDMTLSVSADIDVAAADGTRLQGQVIFQEDVAINYISLTACTGSSGGDADGDGAVGVEFGGDDCDDTNASIGPHATEVCDGIDNDCDGDTDEDVKSTFYKDNDGDSWGDPSTAYEACEMEDGDVDNMGDCDDTDASIRPESGPDECDGIDNDCDEIIDEDGRVGHYPDNDGDGYGADLPPELYCEDDAPDDYVTTPYDCNDEDETVNPDGTEVCGDGEDNDCDGGVDNLPECD